MARRSLWHRIQAALVGVVQAMRLRHHQGREQVRLRLEKAQLLREQEVLLKKLGQEVVNLRQRGLRLHRNLDVTLAEFERLEHKVRAKDETLQRYAQAGQQENVAKAPPYFEELERDLLFDFSEGSLVKLSDSRLSNDNQGDTPPGQSV